MDVTPISIKAKEESITPKCLNSHESQMSTKENNASKWMTWLSKKKSKNLISEKIKDGKKKVSAPQLSIFQLFRYSTKGERAALFIGTFCAILMGFTLPATLILLGDVTQAFVDYGANITTNNISVQSHLLWEAKKYGANMGILTFLQVVFGYIFVLCFSYTAENQIFRIRTKFLKAMLRQDMEWYDTHATTDFCSKITENLQKLQEGIGEKASICLGCTSTCVVCFGVAFYYGWKLTLVMLSTVPLMIIANVVAAKVQATLIQKELKAYGKAGCVAEEVLTAIKTVVAFGGQQKEVQRYADRLVHAQQASVRRAIVSGLGNGFFWFMIYATYALAFWYGIQLVIDGRDEPDPEYDPAALTIIFLCLLLGSLVVGQSSPYFETFASAQSATVNIFEVMERQPVIDSASDEGLRPDRFEGVIEFCNVHFNYPARPTVKILRGLNLKVNPGETVALVGGSGCGKSTILQLLQRFYDPQEGVVKVDGVDIKMLNVQWLRSHFGVVGQEPVLFDISISENIKMGKEGMSQSDVEKAAQQANAHDFITKLPEQYNTLVGERGAQLSGGQKQRVAIARALVRDPKVLLLDEATSALDLHSEAIVQKALDVAKEGRTTFIVAHRLSTIRSANRILVLEKGQVQEEGSHEELMMLNGLYHQLVMAQIPAAVDEEAAEEVNKDQRKQLERLQSYVSSSSTVMEFGSNALPEQMNDDAPPMSMWEILKANSTEMPYIVVGTIASALQGFSLPLYAIIFGEIIATLAVIDNDEARYYGNFYSLCFIGIAVLSGLAAFFQNAMFAISGDKLTLRLRQKTFAAMVMQEIGWFDDIQNSSGALCSRLSSDAASVQGATGNRIGTLIQAIFSLALSVVLSVYLSWKLGLVTTALVPLVFFGSAWENKLIIGQNFSEKHALEQASRKAMEAITNIRTVASLGQQKTFLEMYTKYLAKPHAVAKRNAHARGFVYGFSQAIPNMAYAVCMVYGAFLVVQDGMNFSTVFKVSEALVVGAMVMGQAISLAPNYSKGRVAAARIFQLLKRCPKINDIDGITDETLCVTKGTVEFQEVEFNYPSRPGERIMNNISFSVADGQTVAVVGPSGCGKSTCIQLLLRFYEPSFGKIMVDNHDVCKLKMQYLRAQLGLVSQEPVLFDRTVAENIAYGDNSRIVPMEKIIEAARMANIHNFISGLPEGYETRVGEKGAQLSGGQKQRVAIARALVRNPKILLLDEATSALDTESEKVVQAALEKAQEGRTCIVIAHRLSTIQQADLIVVMKHGRIVETGSHAELLTKKGLYHKLCSLKN